MSRKMIEYEVEEGKIKSIDGYNVGGDELHFKTLSMCIYSDYRPNDEKELTELSDGTWMIRQSQTFELSKTFSAEDLEIIKRAKLSIVIPTNGITDYGDTPTGRIITEPVDADVSHPESQGYKIVEVKGKYYLSARYISYVTVAANTTTYSPIYLRIACRIALIY